MTPEQYRRAGELYHAALELAPEARADASPARRITSLLSSFAIIPESFLEATHQLAL
jgi:hypothetical protein